LCQGHGESDGDAPTTLTHWIEDIESACAHALNGGDPAPTRLLLVGYSLGGLAAAHAAARHPAGKAGLVLLAPGLGLLERLRSYDRGGGSLSLPSSYVAEGSLSVGRELLEDLEKFPTDAEVAKALHLPTLLVHGEADDVVAFKLAAAFSRQLADSRLLSVAASEGGDHRLNAPIDTIMEEIEAWMPSVLGAAPS